MKNIKFRFYRTKLKEMVYGFKGCSTTYVLNLWENEKHVTEPMQYTGLKDKNGVEIFDKDIVEIKGHAFQGAIDIDGNYEVGYNEYMELCCGNLILFRQLPYATVIGNIYEHPHLLEVAL